MAAPASRTTFAPTDSPVRRSKSQTSTDGETRFHTAVASTFSRRLWLPGGQIATGAFDEVIRADRSNQFRNGSNTGDQASQSFRQGYARRRRMLRRRP